MLRLLSVLCVVMLESAIRAQQLYKVYPNASSPDFESLPPASTFAAATFADCLIQSLANQVDNNGAMYNSATLTCVLFTTLNNEVMVRLRTNISWTSIVKDFSTKFALVFKAQAGQGSSNMKYDLYSMIFGVASTTSTAAWTSATQSYYTNTSCNCTYRNVFLDYWGAKTSDAQVSVVRMRMWASGVAAVEMTFSASSATCVTWMSVANLLTSKPYLTAIVRTSILNGLLTIQNGVVNGLKADTANSTTCSTISGFLQGASGNVCSFFSPVTYPVFYYSLINNAASYIVSVNFGYADFFTIEVLPTKRVVFM